MPLLFIAIPLFAVVGLNILNRIAGSRTAFGVSAAVALIQMGLASADVVMCFNSGAAIISDNVMQLSVDIISAAMLFIIGLLLFVTLLVAKTTVEKAYMNFTNILLLLTVGMNGIVMAEDLFSLYVFIEVTSAASFILIALNKNRDELEGAFKYYLMSALATVMFLLSIAFFFVLTGDVSFTGIRNYISDLGAERPVILMVASALFLMGGAIKSGMVPFHTWVPDAHSSAPSPVSVVLACAVIKVSGVYALLRLFRDMFSNDTTLGRVLMVLGILSIVVGALGAIGQNDIKRMLAFSSVSQIGYIAIGISTGTALGVLGAMFHFFNHATFKSLLFADAAAVFHETGSRDMSKMGGLAAKMPVTALSSVIGLLSMAGIPPLSGFWSKLLVIIAVWQVSGAAAMVALAASLLTLGYFLVLQKKVFFGKLAPHLEHVKECPKSMVFAEVLLCAINVLAGALCPFVFLFMQSKGFV